MVALEHPIFRLRGGNLTTSPLLTQSNQFENGKKSKLHDNLQDTFGLGLANMYEINKKEKHFRLRLS